MHLPGSLRSRSRSDGRKAVFLERATFRLFLPARLEESLREELPVKVLEDLDEVRSLCGQVVRLRRAGDADGPSSLLAPAVRRHPRIHDRFMRERNRRRRRGVEEFPGGEEDVLVVDGEDHFAGPDGLPAQLRAAGQPVQRR